MNKRGRDSKKSTVPLVDEPRLIGVYQEMTGSTESAARCAVMFIIFDGRDTMKLDRWNTQSS
jgi:hypothetical protein